MLTITGCDKQRFCDGLSRRSFLQIGAFGGAFSLADMLQLRAESAAATRQASSNNKAVIMIYLGGGPPHMDTYDLKPNAPKEIRGPYIPIATNVPGIEICEALPEQARIFDKMALIRSVVPAVDEHSDSLVMTGFSERDNRIVQRPAFGAVVSKLCGGAGDMPPFVSLRGMSFGHEPGYLGVAHRPFTPSGEGLENLTLAKGLTSDRLGDRQKLLKSFDNLRRDVDASGKLDGIDAFTGRAIEMIYSGKVRKALDLKDEDPKTVALYQGHDTALRARRLVEAGVGCVTMSLAGNWDHHVGIFKKLPGSLPVLDRGVAALVTDLYQRGLQNDVSVVVWGEFGRTPRINDRDGGGRDHWAPVMSVLVAGGGMRMGQVIGATDKRGELTVTKPYSVQQVLSTLYHQLGIDSSQTFPSGSGRPMYILEDREPIRELIG